MNARTVSSELGVIYAASCKQNLRQWVWDGSHAFFAVEGVNRCGRMTVFELHQALARAVRRSVDKHLPSVKNDEGCLTKQKHLEEGHGRL